MRSETPGHRSVVLRVLSKFVTVRRRRRQRTNASRIFASRGVSGCHVQASLAHVWQHSTIVDDAQGAFPAHLIDLNIRPVPIPRTDGRIIALHSDIGKGRGVIALLLDIRRVPVDLASSPVDSTLGVNSPTCWPE